MAIFVSGGIEWFAMGGNANIQIPDRVEIYCAKCGQTLAKDKANLIVRRLATDDGKLVLDLCVECRCGNIGPARVKDRV